MKNIEAINAIGMRLTKKSFSPLALAEYILYQGGMDTEPLTKNDLISLMEETFNGNWDNVAFSFSELASYYQVPEKSLNDYDVVAWCFVSLVIGETCRRDLTDWRSQFHCLMNGFQKLSNKLEFDEALYILRHTFAE